MSNKLGRVMMMSEFKVAPGGREYFFASPEAKPRDGIKVHVYTPEKLREALKDAFKAGIKAETSGPDFNYYAKELGL